MKRLFHVKAEDGKSMHVIARDWSEAVRKWKRNIVKKHNEFQSTRQIGRMIEASDVEEPLGIEHVADESELIT